MEGKDPYDILVEEVWVLIFDKLEDPCDKLSLLQTNSQFKRPFLQKKTEWQFRSILPMLFDISEDDFDDHDDSDFNYKEAFKNCRLVSTGCCETLDKFVTDFWRTYDYSPPYFHTDENGQRNWTETSIGSREQLQKFLKDFGNGPQKRSPFLSGYLTVHCSDSRRQNEVKPSVADALDLIKNTGKHLQSLSMFVDVHGSSDSDPHPTLIAETFSSLLNIRKLSIYFFDYGSNSNYPAAEVRQPLLLPDLAHLSELKIHGEVLPFPLTCFNFQKYFSQLTQLEINFDLWREDYNVEGLFLNLKQLYLGDIDILDKEELLFGLFLCLDSPHLEYINISAWIDRPERKQKRKAMDSLEKLAVVCMKKRYPKRHCYSDDTVWGDDLDRLNVNIFIEDV